MKLKGGNVMLDFLKVPCSIPVNNVSWEKIECRNKIPRGIVFYPGEMFSFKKEAICTTLPNLVVVNFFASIPN